MVKTANPFVPTVSLLTVPQRNRRGWVKFAILSVLGGHAVFLLALLIHDYQSELNVRARSEGDAPDLATPKNQPSPEAVQPLSANLAAASIIPAKPSASQPTPDALPKDARVTNAESASPAVARAEISYTVRSGDTLSQIARLYGTSVKAIKASNRLTTERLAVGAKLKLPNARLLASSAPQPDSLQ